MIRIYIPIFLFSLFISGCFSEEQKQTIKENRLALGEVKINYYSDKSVTSLEIPPDLTTPSYQNSFRLSEYANVDENTVNLTNKNINENEGEVLPEITDIKVIKSGTRKWLLVEKDSETVWNLSKDFLKQSGFAIKKSNKKIGIMETDYLENKPVIPGQSLGLIRSFFANTIDNVSYTLPSVDSYRLRVEPVDKKNTQVYLTLSSMREVVQGSGKTESTIWESKERDVGLETEMLYKLMVYLGSDSAKAKERILSAKENRKVKVTVLEGINGYSKMVFNLNFIETWDNLAWAIDQLNLELEDRDIKEKSFYLRAANPKDLGIMSALFGDEPLKNTIQLSVNSLTENTTEVYFNNISEKNPSETKDYSQYLFNMISKVFD